MATISPYLLHSPHPTNVSCDAWFTSHTHTTPHVQPALCSGGAQQHEWWRQWWCGDRKQHKKTTQLCIELNNYWNMHKGPHLRKIRVPSPIIHICRELSIIYMSAISNNSMVQRLYFVQKSSTTLNIAHFTNDLHIPKSYTTLPHSIKLKREKGKKICNSYLSYISLLLAILW